MIWIWLLLLLLMVLLIYLLAAPFSFRIDSKSREVVFRYHLLARGSVYYANETWWIQVKFLFWRRKWDLIEVVKKQRKKVRDGTTSEENPKPVRRSSKGRAGIPLRRIIAVIKSFRIRELILRVDTGDPALNGMLYPFFFLAANQLQRNVEINFLDQNEFVFEVDNTMARMIWAFVTNTKA